MRIIPFRLMILHLSQMGFTLVRTFILSTPYPRNSGISLNSSNVNGIRRFVYIALEVPAPEPPLAGQSVMVVHL
jgi:hypothetical protein